MSCAYSSDMQDRSLELYQPALDVEVREFSRKLDRVAGNFAMGDGFHVGVDIERAVTLVEGAMRVIRFNSDFSDTDTACYEVNVLERLPMNTTWDMSVVATLLGKDYMGLNESEQIKKLKEEYDIDDEGFIEGYIESERILKIHVGRRSLESMVAFNINILDDSYMYVDCNIGYTPSMSGTDEDSQVSDLARLTRFGELCLDTDRLEDENSTVRRVDLLMVAEALKGSGLMHPLVSAYRGAPVRFTEVNIFTKRSYEN